MREFMEFAPDDLVEREELNLHESDDGVGAIVFFFRWTGPGVARPATIEAISNALQWVRLRGGSTCPIDIATHAVPSELHA